MQTRRLPNLPDDCLSHENNNKFEGQCIYVEAKPYRGTCVFKEYHHEGSYRTCVSNKEEIVNYK